MTVKPLFKGACLTLGLVLLAFSGLAEEYKMYKWVDEDGTIHFSQIPPPVEQSMEQVGIQVHPAIAPVVTDYEVPTTTSEEETTSEEKASEDPQPPKGDLVAQQRAAFEKNCSVAQQNKQTFENNPGRRFIDQNGNVIRMSEEERQAKIQETQDQIDFYCR